MRPWGWTRAGRSKSGPKAPSSIRPRSPSPSRASAANGICSKPKVFFRYANGVVLEPGKGAGVRRHLLRRERDGHDRPRQASFPIRRRLAREIAEEGRRTPTPTSRNWLDCIQSRKRPNGRHRDRPPFGHGLPPGQHRPLDRPQAAMGPGQGEPSPTTRRPTSISIAARRKPYELPETI